MKVLFLNPQQEMGGIQCLSAFLKRAGHETALVNDPKLFHNPWIQYPWLAKFFDDSGDILRKVLEHQPDLIAFSVVTDEYLWALSWAQKIKARSNIPVVFGNVHPTFHPDLVLPERCVDYVIRGEGEHTLLELVEALEKKRAIEDVPGLGYKRGDQTCLNPMRPLIENLDSLPFPDKDLY